MEPILARRAAVCVAAGLFSGCAATMSAEDCAVADWARVGEADGAAGEPLEKFQDRADACQDHGFSADRTRYEEGRAVGLTAYCTPLRGFDAGRAGETYRGVCPQSAEPGFLAEFELGRQLRGFERAFDEAVNAYDDALKSLERHRRDLKSALARVDNGDLPQDDREKARQDADYHLREIERLEYDLPLLEVDIDRAGRELDEFTAWLDRRR